MKVARRVCSSAHGVHANVVLPGDNYNGVKVLTFQLSLVVLIAK